MPLLSATVLRTGRGIRGFFRDAQLYLYRGCEPVGRGVRRLLAHRTNNFVVSVQSSLAPHARRSQ